MKKMTQLISEAVETAFAACGYDKKYGAVSLSNRPDLCQYQCSGAMAAAKEYKKAPKIIADEVFEKLQDSEMFHNITTVLPGFINITLNPSFLASCFNQMIVEPMLGITKAADPAVVIIDYGGANIAKPLHVGHLRPAVIGECIKRFKRHMGHHVIGDVHLGDFGMPMGLVIEQLRDEMPDLVYFQEGFLGQEEESDEPPFDVEVLEKAYPAASIRSKEDETFKKRAQEATLRLQNKQPAEYALWKQIMKVSISDLKRNYDNLNTEFDIWKGESDAEPYMGMLAREFQEKGYAYISQGALVVDVAEDTDKKEMPPCMIQKSDAAFTYAASDIATIYEREKLFKPDMYIYITDKRQDMHFEQVFRTVKKTGLVKQDKELLFLGHGTMCGKDAKPFKTRDGGVYRLDALIRDIEERVFERILGNKTMDVDEARKTAKIVGLAALKYGDLSNQITKDYVFDLERFTSFEGDTGPYILYTIVRIRSILSKYRENQGAGELVLEPINTGTVFTESEIEILLTIVRYNEALENAERENAPHRLCQYIYELSNSFSKFYQENKIITETDKQKQRKWVSIIMLVYQILYQCIDLLGFEAPEKM